MAVRIVDETSQHHADVARLLCAAFDGGAEAQLVEDLRNGGHIACALVAEDERCAVIGHIVFSHLAADIGGRVVPAVGLAPLAVAAACRRKGIGAALVEAGLARCRQQGTALAVVLGGAHYYGRFGFSVETAREFQCPYAGPHLQVAELSTGALGCGEGRLSYAPPFDRLA